MMQLFVLLVGGVLLPALPWIEKLLIIITTTTAVRGPIIVEISGGGVLNG